jgi:hypothetical protein
MVNCPMSIVLPNSNENRVGSMGRGRYSCSGLIRTRTRIGASIGMMTFFSTSIALLFNWHWVFSSLGPLNILASNSRGLEIIGALNHLMLQGREWLTS